jgi:signal transduction histidine kinase
MNSKNVLDKTLRILHLEDSPLGAEIIRERLIDAGFSLQLDLAANKEQFIAFLESGGYDLVLADYHLPAFEGEEALRLTKQYWPDLPFICVSGAIGEIKAVELLKEGATDYVSKALLDKLPLAIVRALDEEWERRERRLAEEATVRLGGELFQAQKMESVGRLAGGVAHDFNNMLGVILGYTEMMLMRMEPSQQFFSELVEIRKAAERSADLTRQLLAFARKQTIEPKVLDLNEIVAVMLKMLQRLIGENIQLTWKPAADLWPVRMDPSQIDQILANLCVNARDAIENIGRVTIETHNRSIDAAYCSAHVEVLPGEYLLLVVSDSGCGMTKETQANIFEPFFTTKAVGVGTGLGLSTVFGIVKQNNGFINVYSEPGSGSTFTIYLPRHRGAAGPEQMEGKVKPLLRGQETVLLVEDEPSLLEMIGMILESLGYTVLRALSPVSALRMIEEYADEIQLLMTDVVMPGMNGRDLVERVRVTRPGVKYLFMSGYTADVIADNGVLEQGFHFMQKPFSLPVIAAKVREVLDSE